jgi:hypothetical protein
MKVIGQLYALAALPCRTYWIRGWVIPRADLDIVLKRKIPSPGQESNPEHPIVQPVTRRYTD